MLRVCVRARTHARTHTHTHAANILNSIVSEKALAIIISFHGCLCRA